MEYKSKSSQGVFSVPAGASQQCVPAAELYTLTPRGCHRFQPDQAHADTSTLAPTVSTTSVAVAALQLVNRKDLTIIGYLTKTV